LSNSLHLCICIIHWLDPIIMSRAKQLRALALFGWLTPIIQVGFTEPDSIVRLARNNPQAIVVIDEIYGEYAPRLSVLPYVNEVPNLMVCKGFSKVYGMAVTVYGDSFKKSGVTAFVSGNHDTKETVEAAKAVGWHVVTPESPLPLDDDMVILGAGDPDQSIFGYSTVHGQPSNAELGKALSDKACTLYSEGKRPIVIGHEPAMVLPSVQGGCAGLGLFGHMHARSFTTVAKTDGTIGAAFGQGTSGGADNMANLVGVQGDATSTVYYVRDGVVTRYYEITVKTDGSVQISAEKRLLPMSGSLVLASVKKPAAIPSPVPTATTRR
jgi:hypothetical protein